MAVVIRLMRAGAKKRPFYRVVAADSRRQRDGRFLEILGHYNPIAQPHELKLQKEQIEKWIARGAQPSEQVASLLRSSGIAVMAPKTVVAEEKPKAKAAAKKKPARKKARVLSARKVKKKAAKKVAKKAKSAAKAAK